MRRKVAASSPEELTAQYRKQLYAGSAKRPTVAAGSGTLTEAQKAMPVPGQLTAAQQLARDFMPDQTPAQRGVPTGEMANPAETARAASRGSNGLGYGLLEDMITSVDYAEYYQPNASPPPVHVEAFGKMTFQRERVEIELGSERPYTEALTPAIREAIDASQRRFAEERAKELSKIIAESAPYTGPQIAITDSGTPPFPVVDISPSAWKPKAD